MDSLDPEPLFTPNIRIRKGDGARTSTMKLLDLATEVIVEILIAAVYARGLRRALRLRLVCKTFDALVYDALFATDLLDEYASSGGLVPTQVYIENSVPPTYYLFWQSYLALRVQSRKRTLTDRMTIIKRTAELFCLEAGLSGDQPVQECIWALCDIRIHELHESLFRNAATPLKRELPIDDRRAVLVAAARMNNVPLALKILEEWATEGYLSEKIPLFGRHNGFQCSSYIAARSASNEVLDLFLQDHRYFKNPRGLWRGCGLGGNMETLNVIFKNRPAEGTRANTHDGYPIREPIFCGLYASRHPKFFDQLRWLWLGNGGASPSDPVIASVTKGGLGELFLTFYARWGYGEMVEYLIKLGVPVNASAFSYEKYLPLQAAARGFQPGIVRLLLEHGADPNQCDALIQGTKVGSLEIVRTLLNHGANVHDSATQLIKLSIRLEHVSMFNLLREHGALTEEARRLALEEALKEGLDSMVTLLRADDHRETVVNEQLQKIGDIQLSV